MKTEEKDLEQQWLEQRDKLLRNDPEYSKAVEAYKMKSPLDWALFGIPVLAGIMAMQFLPAWSELLRFGAAVGITIVVFILCTAIQSWRNPNRPLSDIEADIKKRFMESLSQKSEE